MYRFINAQTLTVHPAASPAEQIHKGLNEALTTTIQSVVDRAKDHDMYIVDMQIAHASLPGVGTLTTVVGRAMENFFAADPAHG